MTRKNEKNVIFSDESSFTVRLLKQCSLVWRKANFGYLTANIVPKFGSDKDIFLFGQHFHYWDAFHLSESMGNSSKQLY